MLRSILSSFGALAQLGERIAGSDEVRGSIPLGSTKKNKINHVLWTWFSVLLVEALKRRTPGFSPHGRNEVSRFRRNTSNVGSTASESTAKVLVE